MAQAAASLGAALQREFRSFKSPPTKEVSSAPKPGDSYPVTNKLQLPSDKPSVVVFLRHCGCPFAEKTFKRLTELSARHASDLHCVAVSHSSKEVTDRWIVEVGGDWEVEVVVDEERDVYAAWGLGLSSAWHALGPMTLYSAYRMGVDEGIWNRPTESGSRWQTGGAFAVGADGKVIWAHVSQSANDVPDFDEAAKLLAGRAEDPRTEAKHVV